MPAIDSVLISISSKLLDSHTADMESVILEALEESRIALGVDRISCLPIDPTIRQGRHYESFGQGIPPVDAVVPENVRRRYRELIQQGQVVFSKDCPELLELANQLQSATILNHVLVPIRAMGKPWGLMACANFVSKQELDSEFVHSATLLGNIIASSIERLMHYENLRRSEKEVIARNHRIVNERERERRTIARDLHDDFSQRLASLGIEMAIALGQCNDEARPAFTKCASDLADITRDIQHLSRHLHPVVIERVGLHAAIASYVEQVTKRSSLDGHLELDRSIEFDSETALHLYRVIQESLSNVVKHAQASDVWVRLYRHPQGDVVLEVDDNGVGIIDHPSVLDSPTLGLRSMIERGELIGATVSYLSNHEEKGMTVKVTIPSAHTREE
ncbi:GAF domain-containing sensor histidine kinase [Vibrio astriarenae]|uniref:GAF domain-containing sensor histidine kinase n=1 Tax=Vibrio astriarenae TaxID=1481923 RepID=UPI003736156D